MDKYKKYEDVVCDVCGTTYERRKVSRAIIGKRKNGCSYKCRAKLSTLISGTIL